MFIVTTHLFYFTDRVSEKSNAIGRVCLSARLLPALNQLIFGHYISHVHGSRVTTACRGLKVKVISQSQGLRLW